jgi:hypothetical protein
MKEEGVKEKSKLNVIAAIRNMPDIATVNTRNTGNGKPMKKRISGGRLTSSGAKSGSFGIS